MTLDTFSVALHARVSTSGASSADTSHDGRTNCFQNSRLNCGPFAKSKHLYAKCHRTDAPRGKWGKKKKPLWWFIPSVSSPLSSVFMTEEQGKHVFYWNNLCKILIYFLPDALHKASLCSSYWKIINYQDSYIFIEHFYITQSTTA